MGLAEPPQSGLLWLDVPRVRPLIALASAAAALALAGPAAATPYDLGFGGGDGIATFSGLGAGGAGASDVGHASAMQPDGKTVIAGGVDQPGSGRDSMVIRVDPDGTLDEDFGDDGRVIVPFTTGADQFLDVELEPDGQIVVSGSADVGGSFDTTAARFNPDGTLDTDADSTPTGSFSDDGKLIVDMTGTGIDDHSEALIVQGSGKVVVASRVLMAAGTNQSDFGLLRLNEDGTPDGTWGPNGIVTTDIGAVTEDGDTPADMIEQTDDKIVVIGGTDVDGGTTVDDDWAFARYNSNGTLDSGGGTDENPADEFGTDGKTIVPLSDNNDVGLTVVQLSDGRIIGGGYAQPSAGDTDAAVVGLTESGALDSSGFGSGGSRITDHGAAGDRIDGLAVQADGKIAAAGDGPAFMLSRYTPAGALDPAFDGDGVFAGPAGGGADIAAHDGRLTAVGNVSTSGQFDITVIRVHQNDVDSDNVADETDNCLGVANTGQDNLDGDSQGDACDSDDDNDNTADTADAFPRNNAETADTDSDGIGNNADPDDDNDGVADGSDGFPLNSAESVDTDRDGIGNNADPDDDNDTFPDGQDAFPLDHNRWNPNTPLGTNGNDVLGGTPASETICGLLGNDRITGAGGNDELYGDRCKDKTKVGVQIAQATDGKDNISGGVGNDRLFGAGGNDKLNGEDGHDKLYGGGGNDKLTGAAGNDLLRGDSGRDSFSGGAGNDSIYAQDAVRETVDCGAGSKDVARVNRTDKVKNCETVRRSRK